LSEDVVFLPQFKPFSQSEYFPLFQPSFFAQFMCIILSSSIVTTNHHGLQQHSPCRPNGNNEVLDESKSPGEETNFINFPTERVELMSVYSCAT